MTHEEALTFHVAREVRSYRDLPLMLYHFQVKERDEPRPRAGVLRTREFIMKDAYSFDRDAGGLDESYERQVGAYDRIFERSGLEWYRVESDVGMMGGVGAHEYMAPCAAGENEVALSDAGYAANVEIASAEAQAVEGLPAPLAAPEPVDTPGASSIEDVVAAARRARGRADQGDADDPRRRRVRCSSWFAATTASTRSSSRIASARRPARRPRRRSDRSSRRRPASSDRSSARVPVLADEALRGLSGLVAGANEPDRHLRGVEPGRDFEVNWGDVRDVDAGDRCPNGGTIRIEPAIEVGNIFKLGTRYSEPLGAPLPRRERQGARHLDGLLRHRPGADRRGRRRAVRRRAGDLVAARDRAVRRPPGHARQGRARRRAPSPTGSTTSCARPASTSSTTTATLARGRSSPTPSCSARRCA